MALTGNGESFVVASGTGGSPYQNTFGLLANFVGGNLDELAGNPYIGVWRGFDSTYVLLAPAFNSQGLQAQWAAMTPGNPVPLYAGPDGRLCAAGTGTPLSGGAGSQQEVAYIVNYQAPSLLEINLVI